MTYFECLLVCLKKRFTLAGLLGIGVGSVVAFLLVRYMDPQITLWKTVFIIIVVALSPVFVEAFINYKKQKNN